MWRSPPAIVCLLLYPPPHTLSDRSLLAACVRAVTDTSKLNVTVLEAVSIDDIDPEAVKTGLAQYAAAYASANATDLEKSEAEIGVNVYQAMSYAIAE